MASRPWPGVATERGWGEKYAFLILAVLLLLVVAAVARRLPTRTGSQVFVARFLRGWNRIDLGLRRHPEPRSGCVLRLGQLHDGHVPQARIHFGRQFGTGPVLLLRIQPARFHGLEQRGNIAMVVGALPLRLVHHPRDPVVTPFAGLSFWLTRISASASAGCTSRSLLWRCPRYCPS
jgi:hypothetical protein